MGSSERMDGGDDWQPVVADCDGDAVVAMRKIIQRWLERKLTRAEEVRIRSRRLRA